MNLTGAMLKRMSSGVSAFCHLLNRAVYSLRLDCNSCFSSQLPVHRPTDASVQRDRMSKAKGASMTWRPAPWPRRNVDLDMTVVRDVNTAATPSGACGTHPSTQEAEAHQKQSADGPQKRAQKRKCCDVTEESAAAPDVFNAKSSMCRALTQTPQFLYTVGGEAIPGARSNIKTSGALWSTDAWIEQPSSWQEHRVSVVDPSSVNTGITRTKYDKAFCAEWINNSQLAVSTKCGHVLRVDRDKKTYKEVELVGRRWVEPPIITEEDLHRYRVDRGGIHSLHANRAKHLLACSGCRDDDNNVYVLDLLSDKWATVKQGSGHTDWVFTLSWISDHTFVTGGRDKSVLLWQPHATDQYVMKPVARYDVHCTKVRPNHGCCLLHPLGCLHALLRCSMVWQLSMHAVRAGEKFILRPGHREVGHDGRQWVRAPVGWCR